MSCLTTSCVVCRTRLNVFILVTQDLDVNCRYFTLLSTHALSRSLACKPCTDSCRLLHYYSVRMRRHDRQAKRRRSTIRRLGQRSVPGDRRNLLPDVHRVTLGRRAQQLFDNQRFASSSLLGFSIVIVTWQTNDI